MRPTRPNVPPAQPQEQGRSACRLKEKLVYRCNSALCPVLVRALSRLRQHFNKSANCRIGAAALRPNRSDIVPRDGKLGQDRRQLRALDPGGRGKTCSHSDSRASRDCGHDTFACIDNNAR